MQLHAVTITEHTILSADDPSNGNIPHKIIRVEKYGYCISEVLKLIV